MINFIVLGSYKGIQSCGKEGFHRKDAAQHTLAASIGFKRVTSSHVLIIKYT